MTLLPRSPARRRFIRRLTGAGAAATAWPAFALPQRIAARGKRHLAFVHTRTGERLSLAYALQERRIPAALGALDRFLRDHHTGEVARMDPALFDLLYRVQLEFGHTGAFEVISGFRGAATNARLRRIGGGGVALPELRDAALALRSGGVGFYAREQFVHLDTGRVRAW